MQGREERDLRVGGGIHAHHMAKYEHESIAADSSSRNMDFVSRFKIQFLYKLCNNLFNIEVVS